MQWIALIDSFSSFNMDLVCLVVILCFVSCTASQDCDTNSDSTQCSSGQICRNNVCETALNCTVGGNDCSGSSGTTCIADYCQPRECNATGQCVHGQVCPQDWTSQCVYHVVVMAQKGKPVSLNFTDPGSGGPYNYITWYKGTSRRNRNKIASFAARQLSYYNEYCSGISSPCRTSTKGQLNSTTGELTIYQVEMPDAAYYFYDFIGSSHDTGGKYEINLTVSDLPAECDSSHDLPQCTEGEICHHGFCREAGECTSESDCAASNGTTCVTDYCQPPECTATWQCIHGQVCSQNPNGRVCVYPVTLIAQEGSEVSLQFTEPGSGGPYEEIVWHKGAINSSGRIVFVNNSVPEGQLLYYNDYCSGSSTCKTSEKGHLNKTTGEFTIYSVELTDDDYYYYDFYISRGSANTGLKYEINLTVSEMSTVNKSENKKSHNLGFVFVLVFGALICIIIIVTVVYSFRRRKWKKSGAQEDIKTTAEGMGLAETARQEDAEDNAIPMKNTRMLMLIKDLDENLAIRVEESWIDSCAIRRGGILGTGYFGLVWSGEMQTPDGDIKIAMKTMKGRVTPHETDEFLREATRMKMFDHPNVLSLLGISVYEEVPCVILPFMSNGDLRTYMRNNQEMFDLTMMFHCALGAAQGMEHLEQQRFVHRDLAARNCMLDSDLVLKVSDFGLTRDIYDKDYYRIQNKSRGLPIRWMSIESMKESIFTTQSDVWSYGVLLWEIFTKGGTPYQGLENLDIREYLERGGRLSKPRLVPDFICDLMHQCWNENPKERPTFQQIVSQMNTHCGNKFRNSGLVEDKTCGYLLPVN